MSVSIFPASSSRKGSVATLSGLVQWPVGAEKAPELPPEDTDESEKDEQTELERWNGSRELMRLSFMRSHSLLGVRSAPSSDILLAQGVLGVMSRENTGSGDRRP